MASPNLQVLFLGFMLIVLCMHHCSARKVLMEDMNKQENFQPKDIIKPASMAHEHMNKQEKSQVKDDIKPLPMANEDMNKQEKGQPKDDVKVKPAPMAHEDMNKQEKAQPKDNIKPAPMAHVDMNKQEKAQPKDDIKPAPTAHEDMNNKEMAQPIYDIKPAPMAHEDMNKQEKGQPNDDVKVKPAPMAHDTDHGLTQKNNKRSSIEGEIGLECGGGGCESPCFELPCNGEVIVQPPGYLVPTPPLVEIRPRAPHIVYPPPVVVRYPPVVVPTPCTPCEPWYGPGPCPCPCEEGYEAEMEGIKTEGGAHDDDKSNKNAQEEGEMQGRPIIGVPAPSNGADAPMPAIFHGSNVHA